MGVREYTVYERPKKIQRPIAVVLAVLAGWLVGLGILGCTLLLVQQRAAHGATADTQVLAVAIGGLAAIVVVRLYWGVWDMVATAWWSHVLLGPVLIVGLVLLLGRLGDLTRLYTTYLTIAEREQANLVTGYLIQALIAAEALTILVVLLSREVFQVGKQRPLWERRRY